MIFLILIILIITLAIGDFLKEDFELEGIEQEKYEGEQLSSVYDFRENSIKGPQYISRENYELIITGLVENTQNFTYDEIINTFEPNNTI